MRIYQLLTVMVSQLGDEDPGGPRVIQDSGRLLQSKTRFVRNGCHTGLDFPTIFVQQPGDQGCKKVGIVDSWVVIHVHHHKSHDQKWLMSRNTRAMAEKWLMRNNSSRKPANDHAPLE